MHCNVKNGCNTMHNAVINCYYCNLVFTKINFSILVSSISPINTEAAHN